MTKYITARLLALSAREREAQKALDTANARHRESWESLQDALAVIASLQYQREQLKGRQ